LQTFYTIVEKQRKVEVKMSNSFLLHFLFMVLKFRSLAALLIRFESQEIEPSSWIYFNSEENIRFKKVISKKSNGNFIVTNKNKSHKSKGDLLFSNIFWFDCHLAVFIILVSFSAIKWSIISI